MVFLIKKKNVYSHKLRLIKRLLPDELIEKPITFATTQPVLADVNQISFF
ncbi:MAG: hypothetical protein HC817_12455 [Saprospiraceae bacterium]|nr:hypothetical protein [Saprospiraceae bacterium]